ncbi:MAG: spore coat protein [Clostridiaceae bacterium]|nr:spore coat protein [Clostridiaceae bacterium]
MPNITTKELSALDDQLTMEQVLVKKYRTFANQCSDPQLRTKCNQIADRHQTHFNTLMNYLG